MTQQQSSGDAAKERPAAGPVPLEYESRQARTPEEGVWDDLGVIFQLLRRGVFALGTGLLVYGLAEIWSGRHEPEVAGWGAALMALVMPWPRSRRRQEK